MTLTKPQRRALAWVANGCNPMPLPRGDVLQRLLDAGLIREVQTSCKPPYAIASSRSESRPGESTP